MSNGQEQLGVEVAAEGSILTASGDPPTLEDFASAESEADVTSPLTATRASVSATDWTIETIVQQMRKGRVDLDPKFQRRAAWTDQTKSRFVESAILNYPIPQVVLAERLDRPGQFLVIDGKQRLLALRQFYAGSAEDTDEGFEPLRLTGLTILEELKGLDIRDVQNKRADLFDAFENHTIRTVVIRNWEVEDFLYTLFLRLNTGSVPLSPQELRQALVPGPFVDFVDAASGESPGLRFLLGNRGPDRRMIDAEILVRFLGFHLGVVTYRGNLKVFLDDTCKALNDRWEITAEAVRRAVQEMEEAIDAARHIFGDGGACHKWSGTRWERSFNRAIFDVQINSLADPTVRAAALAAGAAVKERFMSLCVDDVDFSRSISTTTKSLEATRERFSKWYEAMAASAGVELELPSCLTPAEG
jgi:uncharacterized protein DUF262